MKKEIKTWGFMMVGLLTPFVTTQKVMAQSVLYPQHFDLTEVTLLDGPIKTATELNNTKKIKTKIKIKIQITNLY